MKRTLALLLVLAFAWPASAEPSSPAARAEMAKIAQMAGRWKGGGWIDPNGRPVPSVPAAGPGVTTLTRDGAVVAVVLHRPTLLDDPRLVDEIQRAARLAIDPFTCALGDSGGVSR